MTKTQDDPQMSEQIRRYIAIGAAAAVNCRPCPEHHVPLGRAAGISVEDIKQAIDIGFGVNRGAHAKTKGYIDDVIASSDDADLSAPCCDQETAEKTMCC